MQNAGTWQNAGGAGGTACAGQPAPTHQLAAAGGQHVASSSVRQLLKRCSCSCPAWLERVLWLCLVAAAAGLPGRQRLTAAPRQCPTMSTAPPAAGRGAGSKAGRPGGWGARPGMYGRNASSTARCRLPRSSACRHAACMHARSTAHLDLHVPANEGGSSRMGGRQVGSRFGREAQPRCKCGGRCGGCRQCSHGACA